MLDYQIEALHSQGADVREIAGQLNCSEEAVRYSLTKSSKTGFDGCIGEMEDIVLNIARYGDNERNKLSAAIFAVEVGRGIKSNRNNLPNISAVQINQLIINATNNVERFVNSKRNPRAIGAASGDPSSSGQVQETIETSGPKENRQRTEEITAITAAA